MPEYMMNGDILKPDHSTKYLEFYHVSNKPKTKVWEIVSIRGIHLGTIQWYSRWRQYCFFPQGGTVYNRTCMNEISEFIDTQMEARKKEKGI